MFTAAWCGPCKIVKPVFEGLARRDSSLPPVAFVLVDPAAGGEIINRYSISAFPTFKFFLSSTELHEIKGADPVELRTQVEILSMTGYPPHPHTRINCSTLSDMSPSPIMSGQKPNFDTALSKLSNSLPNSPSATALADLRRSCESLGFGILATPQSAILLSASQIVAFELDASQMFPLLDILRYAILQSATALVFAESRVLLFRILQLSSIDGLPKPTFVTLLRFLGNALDSPVLAATLLADPNKRTHVSELLVKGLLHDDRTIRMAAGNLAYSLSGWLRKQRKTWVDDASVTEQATEEFESELLTALLEAIEREQSPEVGSLSFRCILLDCADIFLQHIDWSPLWEEFSISRLLPSTRSYLWRTHLSASGFC